MNDRNKDGLKPCCSFKLGLLKITGKAIKNKNKTINGKERLINLLLILNYTSHATAKCNHISYVAMHITPILQGHKHLT